MTASQRIFVIDFSPPLVVTPAEVDEMVELTRLAVSHPHVARPDTSMTPLYQADGSKSGAVTWGDSRLDRVGEPRHTRGRVLAFIVRRLAAMCLLLAATSAIVFAVGRLAPGDPVQLRMGDLRDPVLEARIRGELGLDRPLWEQYWRYVSRAARGDLGESYASPGRSVGQMLGEAFPVTLRLALVTVTAALCLGVPLGVLSAVARGSVTDVAMRLVALAGVSVPSFVVAVLLILTLALGLHLVPVSGWGEPRHYVLPVLALLVQPLAYITRVTRAGVLQVLGQDYVRTAHAKGLPAGRVLLAHVLPNAAISVITVTALALSYALTGALVVETIFRIPGMGQAAVGALFLRDYPTVQAVGLLYTVVFVGTSLLADVGYALVDPRIRY